MIAPTLRFAWTLPIAAVLIAADPSAAAEPDWSHAQRVEVDLSSFRFSPATINLKAGQPTLLHLANSGSGGHDFTAKEFFAAAAIRPQDRTRIARGGVEIGGHESVEVALVPARGQYPLRCGHAFHSTFGMKGRILVQ
ncbi:cupredoxin domain-containing protein [Sphingosinicella sp. BN140058]|uniref:cupredoxin domain-containing protein n=1 Tax=Sphingosinicella sp. BN140058 TaxID=1892855 RepID=UPI001012C9D3|nr:cupredoxin domain-containing protein [Sphingosinicella sp. BN140058]QAY79293.1 copper-binding protein [Sphingosinicella sp. BN140058]